MTFGSLATSSAEAIPTKNVRTAVMARRPKGCFLKIDMTSLLVKAAYIKRALSPRCALRERNLISTYAIPAILFVEIFPSSFPQSV